MLRDCIAALRSFRRQPLPALAAVLCLALGIGGTTAVFTVVDGVLLRNLPYPDPQRLVLLRTNHPQPGFERGRLSERELRDWQSAARSFEGIAGYRYMTVDLFAGERSERLEGLLVTKEIFSLLGIRPAAGRTLDSDGPAPGVILGRSLWERRFALDPSIAGRTLAIGMCCPQQPRTINLPIEGAIDRDVAFPPTVPGLRDRGHGVNDTIDYLATLSHSEARSERNVEAIAKLKPGISSEQAQAEMNAIARELEERFPASNRGWTVSVVPLEQELFGEVRPALFLLAGAAVFVLLIACANVAVLLTFKAASRFHEIAVRAALGAGAGRMIRQFLAESALLTLGGGAAGLLVAAALRRFLAGLAPAGLRGLEQASIDARMLAFALAAAMACGLLAGLIPALRALKIDLEPALRSENDRSATSRSRARVCEPLIVLQVALTLALLVGSGLMIKSLNRLFGVPTGFDPANVVTATLSLPSAKHEWDYNARFSTQVVERIRGIPGVVAAGAIRGVPMSEVRFQNSFWRWDQPPADPSKIPPTRLRVASPGYFEAMGIPILAGRDFVEQDGIGEAGITKVAVINETMARSLWPGGNALFQKIETGNPPLTIEVVGVVGDARYASIESDPVPEVYFPDGVFPQDEISVVVRTESDPAAMADVIGKAIREVEGDVFVTPFRTMDEILHDSLASRRFALLLLAIFAAIALTLAVAGIAGIVAYSHTLRIREVAIRVAVGARPRDVMVLLARQGLAPAFLGLALGLLPALAVSRALAHMLYTVSPYDPAVFMSSIAALAGVSVIAAGVSARRALTAAAAGWNQGRSMTSMTAR